MQCSNLCLADLASSLQKKHLLHLLNPNFVDCHVCEASCTAIRFKRATFVGGFVLLKYF